jgi:hypothetical protein
MSERVDEFLGIAALFVDLAKILGRKFSAQRVGTP